MKLLHKTFRVYLIFSMIIFTASVPVFYFLVQRLWIEDVDETFGIQKEKIIEGIIAFNLDSAGISRFSKVSSELDLGITVTPVSAFPAANDTVYYNSFYDDEHKHVEPFREFRSFVNINGAPYQIFIRKDLVEGAELIRGIVIAQALLFLLLLAGMMIFNHFFSQKTWHPFYQLINSLKTFRIDKEQAIEVQKTTINEFNDLNQSVSLLMENSIKTFKSQKEFTENASHEIQTPISVIKNQIDLLIQNEDLTKEQAEIVERMDKQIRHLTQLNRNLLLLTKFDNRQFDTGEPADIYSILKETIEIFIEQIELQHIRLQTNLTKIPPISSNSFMLQLLFSNLIKNAIKYNIPGGFIEISLQKEIFQIVNSGTHYSLQGNRIFERFYKFNKQIDGTGLGLPIVKKICELLNYDLNYQFGDPNKHVFTLKFNCR